jgi:hypothetical protein
LHLPHAAHVLCVGNLIFVVLSLPVPWHFVVVDLDADGDGAKYRASELIEWKWTFKEDDSNERLVEATSNIFDPALIAGILSSWVSMLDPEFLRLELKKEADIHCCQIAESFTEFNDDQWLVKWP